ncbi:hypothetical protein R6Q59_010775 [Mikania micrantha]
MKPERIFGKMGHLQRLLDRILSCRPTRLARNNRLVLVALYPVVQESFKLYADICEVLAILLDRFFDMDYHDCVKAFEPYANAAKQTNELVGFYNWCKDMGISRFLDYPKVQKINAKLLETLEEFVRDRAKAINSPEKKPEVVKQLRHCPAANKTNGNWEAFGSNGEPEVTPAWQNLAAEPGKADWELALVETTSILEKQKAAMGGGLDPLLLNGMYDQGMVRQHVSTSQLSGGSASSVVLPEKSATPILALRAPDGPVQVVGGDPFAAS